MRRFMVPTKAPAVAIAASIEGEQVAKRARLEAEPMPASSTSAIAVSSISSVPIGRRYLDSILLPPFVDHASQCPANTWMTHGGVMVKLRSSPDAVYKGILAFDMDGTIITTKSGKTFAVDGSDWKFWHPDVVSTLRAWHDDQRYAIAFISNQAGVQNGKTSIPELQGKVDKIIDAIGLPVDFICSLDNDLFRKPRPGMWHFMAAARWARSTALHGEKVMYIGDAAGRNLPASKVKDFSDSDLKFAVNLDIEVPINPCFLLNASDSVSQFATPESFFLQSKLRVHTEVLSNLTSSIRLVDKVSAVPLDEGIFMRPEPRQQHYAAHPTTAAVPSSADKEIVLLVGPPASGKSTLSQRFAANGFVRINQDTLGTLPACIKAGRAQLQAGHSLVIDNTNWNKPTRSAWMELAKETNSSVCPRLFPLHACCCDDLPSDSLCGAGCVEGALHDSQCAEDGGSTHSCS